MQDLKKSIKERLLTQKGTINSAVIRRDAFKQSELAEQIIAATSFLTHLLPSMSMRILSIMWDITSIPRCPICRAECCYSATKFSGFARTCASRSCSAKASSSISAATKIQRYGSLHSDKWREWAAGVNPDELYERLRKGTIKVHGVANASLSPAIVTKRRQTMQDRYGVDHVGQLDRTQINKRRAQGRASRLSALGNIELHKVMQNKNGCDRVEFTCSDCNAHHNASVSALEWRSIHASSLCPECGLYTRGSIAEQQVADFIKSVYAGTMIRNDRTLLLGNKALELDILLPDINIAVEYNGMFWHSYDSVETSKQRNKHQYKTNECEKLGIQLIQVFESEWTTQQELVKSRLRNILGHSERIFARKTKVIELSNEQHKMFINDNHIQGFIPTQVAYGLEHNGTIVASMTFSMPRYNKNYEWELIRYATKSGTTVVGGASKLFSHFITTRNAKSVISYADRRWSQGNVYKTLGFEFLHNSPPNYFYLAKNDLMSPLNRHQFQKHKLAHKLEIFDSSLTEAENMFNNGYRRIWDCGNMAWVWTKP